MGSAKEFVWPLIIGIIAAVGVYLIPEPVIEYDDHGSLTPPRSGLMWPLPLDLVGTNATALVVDPDGRLAIGDHWQYGDADARVIAAAPNIGVVQLNKTTKCDACYGAPVLFSPAAPGKQLFVDSQSAIVTAWIFDSTGALIASNDNVSRQTEFGGPGLDMPYGIWYLGNQTPPQGTQEVPSFLQPMVANQRANWTGLQAGSLIALVLEDHPYRNYLGTLYIGLRLDGVV